VGKGLGGERTSPLHWASFPKVALFRMDIRTLSITSALLLALSAMRAQDVPFTCSAHGLEHMQSFLQGHPERLAEIQEANQRLENETAHFTEVERGGNAYVIPVVFHIIHTGGIENISDDQVRDAIRVLNDDYNKLNTDWPNVKEEFLPFVADIGITFRLAGLDPQGNCTSGINHIYSDLTNDGGQSMKDLIQWPRDQYLNVWVCAYAQGAAGYTQTPGMVNGFWGAAADGIVLLHNYTARHSLRARLRTKWVTGSTCAIAGVNRTPLVWIRIATSMMAWRTHRTPRAGPAATATEPPAEVPWTTWRTTWSIPIARRCSRWASVLG
jgi:hypothetical protein